MAASPSDLIQINAQVSYRNKGWRSTTSPAFSGVTMNYVCNATSDDSISIRVATSFQDAGYGGWIIWGTENVATPTVPLAFDPAIIFSFNWDGKKGTYVEDPLLPVEDSVVVYSAEWNTTTGSFVPTIINYINSFNCFVDATTGRSYSGCIIHVNKTNLPTNFIASSGLDKLQAWYQPVMSLNNPI